MTGNEKIIKKGKEPFLDGSQLKLLQAVGLVLVLVVFLPLYYLGLYKLIPTVWIVVMLISLLECPAIIGMSINIFHWIRDARNKNCSQK